MDLPPFLEGTVKPQTYARWLRRKATAIDHIGDGRGAPDFVICGFALNAAKSYLSYEDFLALCEKVLKHHHASKKATRHK